MRNATISRAGAGVPLVAGGIKATNDAMARSGSVTTILILLAAMAEAQVVTRVPNRVYDLWDSVVSSHVALGTLEGIPLHLVDYTAISQDANYTAFIDAIAKVNTTGLDRGETYAFFANVYNALAIKMIIEHPCTKSFLLRKCTPIKSIKDIGSLLHPVWKMPAGVVGGKEWSLDDVENYLRDPKPFTEDSRLHASIVCASISCPNVRMEAFRPERIAEQMDDQVHDFLSNTKKGFLLDKSANTLHLSSIFLWFAGDFAAYGGVMEFIRPYISSEDAQYIGAHSPKVQYFDYDWDVNGQPPPCKCSEKKPN